MTLQWSTPTTPDYSSDPLNHPIVVDATRQLSGGNYANAKFTIVLGVNDEYPSVPSESDVLGWVNTIHTAMENDGWTSIQCTQTATSSRHIEDV